MADDYLQRRFRGTDTPSRATPAAGNPSPGSNDPLAELARLIGQNDPFGEFGREEPRQPAAPQPSPQQTEPMLRALAAQIPAQDAHPAEPAAPSADFPAADFARQSFGSAPLAGDDIYQTQGPVSGYEEYAGGEGAGYDPNMPPPYADDGQGYYDDIPPPRRRMGVLAIAAVFALAIIGTAGAFGYRTLFGSGNAGPPPVIKADTAPSKVVPDKDQSAKLINDRVGATGGDQKLVSREERPVDLNRDAPAGVLSQDPSGVGAGAMQTPSLGSGVIGSNPKKIKTITIRPDQAGAAAPGMAAPRANVADATPAAPEPAAREAATPAPAAPAPRRTVPQRPAPTPQRAAPASRNAPLSLTPDAVSTPARTAPARTAPARTASAPTSLSPSSSSAAAAAGGGYAVQVSSRRNEADAQAALRRMQSQYASVIGGQHVLVKRVDLGAKGIYYRAMVGPFGSSEEANRVCGQLKAVGGSCFVQRN